MQYWYDEQVRRYILQFIRIFHAFKVAEGGRDGKDIYLKDIWPSNKEIEDTLRSALNADMFIKS